MVLILRFTDRNVLTWMSGQADTEHGCELAAVPSGITLMCEVLVHTLPCLDLSELSSSCGQLQKRLNTFLITRIIHIAIRHTHIIKKKQRNESLKHRCISILLIFLMIIACCYYTTPSQAQDNLNLYAKAAVLMDADSGRVLYGKEADTYLANASTTKIMTCILAIESGKLDETATVSKYAASMPKVHLGMEEGDTYRLRDLVYSLMLESHNDSAVVIAEHIAGSVEAFSDMMNAKAKELGCKNTHWVTPNGLDKADDEGEHGTTATDLARVMCYCIENEEFLKITQTKEYSFSNLEETKTHSCTNHNAFLNMMEGALSGKTGFTAKAGYCYVGALRQGNRTYVVALLACGWPNNKTYKWQDTRTLMEYGLNNYEKVRVLVPRQVTGISVKNAIGRNNSLTENVLMPVQTAGEDFTILKNKNDKIYMEYTTPKQLYAPITAGTEVGNLKIYAGEELLKEYPIVAMENLSDKDYLWYLQYVMDSFV